MEIGGRNSFSQYMYDGTYGTALHKEFLEGIFPDKKMIVYFVEKLLKNHSQDV